MGSRRRPGELGDERARRIRVDIGREILASRMATGLSIRDASASVGLDKDTYWRIERGAHETVRVDQLARACAAVGLDLVTRAYPSDVRPRDAGQLDVLARLRGQLARGMPWMTEVLVGAPPDRRAWDAMTVVDGTRVAFEAEVRLYDIQAVDRRMAEKLRDGNADILVLVVPDTKANRRILAQHREALRARFPLDTRAVMNALRRGVAPAANGIVLI